MTGTPPIISAVSRPFWDALARHEITMQRCDHCRAWVFYPRAFCPACGGRALTWSAVGAGARLYSWTIARVPVSAAFAHLDQPILAVAELENGVRVPTTLESIAPEMIRIGMVLEPVFDSATIDGMTLLRFRGRT